MNTDQSTTSRDSFLIAEAVNPLSCPIEVEQTEHYAQILIDLNHLLQASGLRYRAAVESHGVVAIDSISKDGMMFLVADPEACSGDRTRVAVRAVDAQGAVRVLVFEVVVVAIAATRAIAA